ncbi:MAG: NADH-quinone oxidoreductase subunit N [Fidelibacterota bacterium]
MDNLQSLQYFWPEMLLAGVAILLLLVDIFRRKPTVQYLQWIAVAGVVLTFIAVALQSGQPAVTLFFQQVVADPFALFFKSLILLATLFLLFVIAKSEQLKTYHLGEFFSLIFFMVLGMFLLVSAYDLVMVYLSLEVVSITSFILAGYMKQNKASNEAALKYVIYGAFSSGLMLFGFSLLYGLTGATNFHAIGSAVPLLGGTAQVALLISVILVLAGFGYKISAVPFHFWTPDVYEGAPTPITAYLSVAPKAAGFAILIRFFSDIFTAMPLVEGWYGWQMLLAVLAAVTMTLGNLVALQQTNVKRMLAYSTIAHAGYMLMGIPIVSQEGQYGIMIYLIMYLFMNLGAFFVVIAVQNRSGSADLGAFRELGWKMPFLGVVMTIFLFSLTGLPPTAGFIGKFYIFAAVIKAGPDFYWLALVGILNSVVSLYYYFRVVKIMFLRGERQETLLNPSRTMMALLICLAVPVLFLGIYWAPIADWVRNSMVLFTNTL